MQAELAVGLPVAAIVPDDDAAASVAAALRHADLVLYDWRFAAPGLDRAAIAGAPRLAFVQQPSVGVPGHDLDALAAAGVPLSNAAGFNATAVAEWVLGALFGARVGLLVTASAGGCALLLALTGLYGSVASTVQRRRRELVFYDDVASDDDRSSSATTHRPRRTWRFNGPDRAIPGRGDGIVPRPHVQRGYLAGAALQCPLSGDCASLVARTWLHAELVSEDVLRALYCNGLRAGFARR
jgi:hypothetical protein